MILSSFFTHYANAAANNSVNVYAKVSKIMQAQNTAAPKLNAALTADKTTLSGLGQLQGALASFQGVAQSLSGNGLNLSASSSDKNVLSATASSRSAAGAYAIQVTQLAQSQVLRSHDLTSPDAAIGSGATSKISIDFGNASGNTFATDTAAKSGQTVIIPSGANTLQGIASAINGANIGVTAKVTHSGNRYALELSSPTGAANSMRIGVSGDPALRDLLAYNPTGTKNLSQMASAQNASLTINGVAVGSPSNTVTGAVPGTTLNLAAKGSSKLEVVQGSAQLSQNVTNLVNAYNTLNAKLNALQQGDLKAEGSALRIRNQLARIFASDSNDATGASSPTRAKIGIAAQKDGSLTIDANKLQNAINADPVSVAALFTNGGKGIADSLASQIQGWVGPAGSIPKKTTAINRDITALNVKRGSLEKALTAQAATLVKLYSATAASS